MLGRRDGSLGPGSVELGCLAMKLGLSSVKRKSMMHQGEISGLKDKIELSETFYFIFSPLRRLETRESIYCIPSRFQALS